LFGLSRRAKKPANGASDTTAAGHQQRNRKKSADRSVHINLSIEHTIPNTVTFCAAYPYPVSHRRRAHTRPSQKLYNLKQLIQQTSYTRRNVRQIAFPTGGWRWQNAYNKALNRSGMMEPHLLMNL